MIKVISKYYFVFILFNTILCYSQEVESNNTSNTSFQKEFNNYDLFFQDNKFDEAIKTMLKVSNSKNELEQVVAYANLADAYLQKKDYNLSNFYLNKTKVIAESTKSKIDDAYYYQVKGRIFYRKQQNEEAIKNLLKSIKILENESNQDIMLGYNYYYLTSIQSRIRIYSEDYKRYSQKNIEYALKSKNLQLILLSYIEQSLFYEAAYVKFNRKKDLESLFYYSENLVDLVNKNITKGFISKRISIMVFNNSASFINNFPYKNYSNIQRAKIAEEQVLKGIKVAKLEKTDSDLLGVCYLTYGEIQSSLGNLQLTEKYYLDAYKLINQITDIYIRKIIVQYISDLYKKTNKMDLAYEYKEKEYKYSKESYEQLLVDKNKYLEAYYNTEQKNLQIKQLEEKNKIYNKQKFLYIGIIAMAIAGLIFLIYLIRYKHKLNKQKTDLLVSEKNETELTLQLEKEEKARLKAEQELNSLQQEQLQKTALATSLQLDKKNSFINELKEKAKEEKNIHLDRIFKDERLVDEEFNEIKNISQEVHPNFFKKINEISKSKLTNLDLKYAAYIYIGLDNQKISALLKVEPKTVRMSKYRLKQKIGLEKEDDLQSFIQNLKL